MPILDVRLVGAIPSGEPRDLARRIADAAAAVFESRPQGTWVLLDFVPEDAYAENAGGSPLGVRPVIVSILEAEPPVGADRALQAARLARAIAGACGRSEENVHLIYEASARGRVAFGGRIVD